MQLHCCMPRIGGMMNRDVTSGNVRCRRTQSATHGSGCPGRGGREGAVLVRCCMCIH